MAFKTTGRWMMLGALLLSSGVVSGCDDDKPSDTGNTGGDGGSDDGGKPDGGEDDGGSNGPMVKACKPGDTKTKECTCPDAKDPCTGVDAATGFVAPCCDSGAVPGKSICGLDSSAFASLVPDSPVNVPACLAVKQPGKQSDHCGELFDFVDGIDDGELSLVVGSGASAVTATLPGCCTPDGFCGAVIDTVTVGALVSDLGLGCVSVARLAPNMDSNMSSEGAPSTGCVPNTDLAGCPPVLLDAGCALLAAQGAQGCDPLAPTPDWVCVAQGLPKVDGNIPNLTDAAHADYKMEYMPEYVFGCGPGVLPSTGNPCIPNVPTTIGGKVDTVVDTKGTADMGDDCLKGAPEYALGCGNGTPTLANPCLVGAEAFYGCEAITAENTPNGIAFVPEYFCGCGDGIKPNTATLDFCLANIPDTICGADEVDEIADLSPALYNFQCGCGDGTNPDGKATAITCLANIPTNLCGQTPVCDLDQDPVCTQLNGDPGVCVDATPDPGSPDGIGDYCAPPT